MGQAKQRGNFEETQRASIRIGFDERRTKTN